MIKSSIVIIALVCLWYQENAVKSHPVEEWQFEEFKTDNQVPEKEFTDEVMEEMMRDAKKMKKRKKIEVKNTNVLIPKKTGGCEERNTNYDGHIVWKGDTNTWQECGEKCNVNDVCAAWTYKSGNCWNKGFQKANRAGHFSGLMNCKRGGCEEENTYYFGHILWKGKTRTMEGCKERCNNTDGCGAWTYKSENCWNEGFAKTKRGGYTSGWKNCPPRGPELMLTFPDDEPCAFPFTWNGKSYNKCQDGSAGPWCSLTPNYDKDGQYRRCKVMTESGKPCHFPWRMDAGSYQQKKYVSKCIEDRSGRKWCSLTKAYDNDKEWSYCVESPYL